MHRLALRLALHGLLGLLVLLIVAGLLGLLVLHDRPGLQAQQSPRSVVSRPSIHAVRELSELVTLVVPVSDVQTGRIDGYLGGVSTALVTHGEIQLGCDLRQAEFTRVDDERQHLVLAVPQPHVITTRLDLRKSEVHGFFREGLWIVALGEVGEAQLASAVLREAEATLWASGQQPDLIDQARCHAEQVLTRFLGSTGWTVEITWK